MKDLKFAHKLLLLVAIPLIAFTIALISRISTEVSTLQEMNRLESLTELVAVSSAMVHELQKERGATAGFLGSKGAKFRNELTRQRQQTDQAYENWTDFLINYEADNVQIKQALDSAKQKISQMVSVRGRVDQQTIDTVSGINYYTDLNRLLLGVAPQVANASSNADISRQTAAFYALLQSKERSGIERAVLSGVFARDQFGEGLYARFLNLVSQQAAFTDTFKALANPEQVNFFNSKMSGPSVSAVMQMRDVARNKAATGGFGVDSQNWFRMATERINLLKTVEDEVTSNILQQASDLSAASSQRLITASLIAVAVLAALAVISIWVIRGIQGQVNALSETMRRVRDDNDLQARAEVLGKDELGAVAESLNSTLATFADAVERIRSTCGSLTSISGETALTVEQNAENLNQQQHETTMVATAVEEMASAVQEVANSTNRAAESADSVHRLTDDGMKVVQKSLASTQALADDIAKLNALIERLNISSGKISNVVSVINDVSEQTNLLALNAAIEAARAGEYGRGFSVVADEVRTLAQRTQASTTEIDSIMRQIQQEVAEADSMVNANRQKMEESLECSEQVEQSLQQISGAINEVNQMSAQIATAAEEQVTVINDVSRSISQIDDSTQHVASGSNEIAGHASSQAQMADELNRMVNEFKV